MVLKLSECKPNCTAGSLSHPLYGITNLVIDRNRITWTSEVLVTSTEVQVCDFSSKKPIHHKHVTQATFKGIRRPVQSGADRDGDGLPQLELQPIGTEPNLFNVEGQVEHGENSGAESGGYCATAAADGDSNFWGYLGGGLLGLANASLGDEALSRTLLVSSGDYSKEHPRSRTFREVHRSTAASVTHTGQFSGSF